MSDLIATRGSVAEKLARHAFWPCFTRAGPGKR